MRARRLRSQWFDRPSRSADLTGGGIALFLFQPKIRKQSQWQSQLQ